MFKRTWLIFAQTVTLGLALWGALDIAGLPWVRDRFRPPSNGDVVTVHDAPLTGHIAGAYSYRDAARRATPAMVNIFNRKVLRSESNPWLDDPQSKRMYGNNYGTSLGSGVLVSSNGYIITNYHVVEAADQISVALSDGRTFQGKLVGADPETDLAVVKIPVRDLPTLAFGNSDNLQVGDVVLAIGNPFGVGQTVTMGIVSALDRSRLGINTFENFIQTDAPINPGNSGGALIDTDGNLVGINSAFFSKSGGSLGIGFAIPEKTAKDVLEQIIRNGGVVRGWVGVATEDLTPAIAHAQQLPMSRGAQVTGLMEGAPGAKAGLEPGDIVQSINGRNISGSDELRDTVTRLKPGDKISLGVWRAGQTLTFKIQIGRRPIPTQVSEEP